MSPPRLPSRPISKRALAAVAAGGIAATLIAIPASAQSVGESFKRDHNVGVRERRRPDYDALGIRAGSFLLLPKVTADATYSDNIYATNQGKVGDTIVGATGELQAISTWSRHQLRGFAKAARAEYMDRGTESNTTYAIGASGQLDVQRDFAFSGLGQYEHLVEPRTASGTPLASLKPIEYDLTSSDFGVAKAFNRLRVKGALSYRDYNYDNGRTVGGALVGQDFRDHKIYRGVVQVDYAVSPDTAVFVAVQDERRNYELSSPLSALQRDSKGYQISIGADFDISQLVRGQIQGGYLNHNFEDARIGDVSGFGAQARVEYFATQLLTLTFRGAREIEDTGLSNTSGYLTTNVSAQADYELLRNLILTARAGFGHDNYRGIDRTDNRFSASAGGVYLLNRSVGVGLLYTRLDQSSKGVTRGPEFAVNRFTLSLTLQR